MGILRLLASLGIATVAATKEKIETGEPATRVLKTQADFDRLITASLGKTQKEYRQWVKGYMRK